MGGAGAMFFLRYDSIWFGLFGVYSISFRNIRRVLFQSVCLVERLNRICVGFGVFFLPLVKENSFGD